MSGQSTFPSFPSFSSAPNMDEIKEVKKKREEKRKKKRHRSKSPTLDQKSTKKNPKDSKTKEPSKPSTLFIIDRKGDNDNLVYESPYQRHVPLYRRSTDRILGVSENWRIDFKVKRKRPGVELYIKGHVSERISYREFGLMAKQIPIHIKLEKGKSLENLSNNYISFKDIAETKVEEETVTAYENPEFKQKTLELNSLLDQDPMDAQKWLSLVNLQNMLLKDSAASKPALQKVVTEKKVAILERALQHLPQNLDLIQAHLRLCAAYMEASQLLNRWDAILAEHDSNVDLWLMYIDFRCSIYSRFVISDLMEVFGECFKSLSERMDPGPLKDQSLIKVFCKACTILSQAGYIEKAIAAYQALIEFNFFCPSTFLTQTVEQRLGLFEAFWESECPRFGEQGAKGWLNSLLTTETLETEPDEVYEPAPEDDHILSWIKKESFEEAYNWRPQRTTAIHEDSEDPYRAVLFSDIESFLFPLSLEAKPTLLKSFVDFLTMFSPPISELKSPLQIIKLGPALQKALSLNSNPCIRFPMSLSSLFDSRISFEPATLLDSLSIRRTEWISEVLKQTSEALPNEKSVHITRFLYESQFNLKQAKKLAKSILKEDSMNLLIWNVYAQMEKKAGNVAETQRIYSTAIDMLHKMPIRKTESMNFFRRMFAETELSCGNIHRAGNIAVSAFCPGEIALTNDPVKPTLYMKAKQAFQTMIQSETIDIQDITFLYAILEYSALDIEHAIQTYQGVLSQLPSCSLKEQLAMDQMHLYHIHASQNAYKPADFRNLIEQYLKQYPENTYFWSIFAWNESKVKIENHFRRRMDETLSRVNCSENLWIWAIWNELESNYNIHHVRALLERAIDNEIAKRSCSIWYLAIHYEIHHQDFSKAKRLFYRGIRECPWAKDLYLIPFIYLRKEFSVEELSDIVQLMEEKEIRQRSNPEE